MQIYELELTFICLSNRLSLLLHNVVRVHSAPALGQEALLDVQEELWPHCASGTVADPRHDFYLLTLRGGQTAACTVYGWAWVGAQTHPHSAHGSSPGRIRGQK